MERNDLAPDSKVSLRQTQLPQVSKDGADRRVEMEDTSRTKNSLKHLVTSSQRLLMTERKNLNDVEQ